MRARLVTLAASVGVVAAMLPGHAATAPAAPKAQITDPTGDANGVNDQGFGVADASLSGPVDDANADIASVLFQTKFKTVTTVKTVVKVVKKKKIVKKVVVKTQVPDGFTVTLNLSAAPDGNHAYDVEATHALCDGTIDFTYTTGPFALNEVDCLPSDPTADLTTYAGDAAVVGNSIVWTVPAGAFPTGSSFTDLYAQTETAALEPVMDTAVGADGAAYKVGS